MITFIVGLCILLLGYIFYSKYVEKQFGIKDEPTPAVTLNDGVDYVPMSKWKNMLIHLLNIAGMGPILGAIQGILFGPVAFIIIPTGCILMGTVHDYFSGMLSLRNNGEQLTGLIKRYLNNTWYKIFIVLISITLLLLSAVFVFTAGDVLAEKFFNQNIFTLNNPIVVFIYVFIILYYIIAALLPIDKIIGRFYPVFGFFLIAGTVLIIVEFFIKGVVFNELNFHNINTHPAHLHILPMFFMTVSCGLLSGFHATQSTIISRTLAKESHGRPVFYGMMTVESVIAMIWAAASMYVYNMNLVPQNYIGTVNVINVIANTFIPTVLTSLLILAVVVLPITSGATALRGLRMIITDAIGIKEHKVKAGVIIMSVITILLVLIIGWAKLHNDSFFIVWRYFNFSNQLIAIPTLLCASVFLLKYKRNYLITLLPALFYMFITMSFILNDKIGFHLNYSLSILIAIVLTLILFINFIKKYKD